MTVLERPYYFITVLWGKRFRDYFLDYALASLLSPNNLPALQTKIRSKFLVATRPDDFAALNNSPLVTEAKKYVDFALVKIPPCPPVVHGCTHMGIGHKLACQRAYEDKAYVAILSPDSIFSDGSISALAKHAADGKKLVLAPACLRIAEEPFLAKLRAMDVIGKRGRPITVTGRQIARAMMGSLHSASMIHEWHSSLVSTSKAIPCTWFRIPGEDGLLVYCLSWAPLLIDYAAFKRHDTSCLENWTIDGDYVFKNLGSPDDVHVSRDSDEIFYAGFTPQKEQAVNLGMSFVNGPRSELDKFKGDCLNKSYYSGIFDPLKQKIFHEPVRIHARDVNEAWEQVERRTSELIERHTASPEKAAA